MNQYYIYNDYYDHNKKRINLVLLCILFVQADKVVQLYETMMTRHTTMVVGPTGGGKSVVIKTLAEAQTK